MDNFQEILSQIRLFCYLILDRSELDSSVGSVECHSTRAKAQENESHTGCAIQCTNHGQLVYVQYPQFTQL